MIIFLTFYSGLIIFWCCFHASELDLHNLLDSIINVKESRCDASTNLYLQQTITSLSWKIWQIGFHTSLVGGIFGGKLENLLNLTILVYHEIYAFKPNIRIKSLWEKISLDFFSYLYLVTDLLNESHLLTCHCQFSHTNEFGRY